MRTIEQKPPMISKIGYGIGSFPDSTYFFAWDLLLLFFYTQVLGLSGSLVGIAILIVMVIDAISDAYVGHFSDNLRGLRFGRRHTLMASSILPMIIAFIALFSPPSGLSDWQLFAWLMVFALISRLAITFYLIPFRAVGAELSRSASQRSQIFAAGAVGNSVARIALPLIAFGFFFQSSENFEKGQLDPANYPPLAWSFAAAIGITMLIQVVSTYRPCVAIERAEGDIKRSSLSPLDGLIAVWRALTVTPNVAKLLGLSIFVFVSIVSISVLKIHVVTYLWQVPKDLVGPLISAQAIGGILGAFLLPFIAGRAERRHVIMFGFVAFAGLNAVALIAPLVSLAPPPGTASLAYMLIGLFFAAGVALGCYFVSIAALGGDIADEHEVNTRQRQQGLIGGFSTFAIKVSSGVMTLITGFFLDIIAFPVGAPVADVPLEKSQQLALFVLAFCVVSAVSVAALVSKIDMSSQKQDRINEDLEAMNHDARQAPAQADASSIA